MKAEVIAVGDELTSGQRIDTNSAWLSERLGELGVRVLYHTTVGDDTNASVLVFQAAVHRADVVIVTGGLGPTADDLTRQALAQLTGRPLKTDPTVLDHIRELFARRGRQMPKRNEVQAMFPEGSRVIPNPHGTAPGIDLRHNTGATESRLFALPGVPAEMRQMWLQTVKPALCQMGAGKRVIKHHVLKCFGVGESELEQRLPDLIRRGRRPSVGITVHKATISLRITAEGESDDMCDQLIAPTIETIGQCLGTIVFGQGEDELQHVIVRKLVERNESLATVEWGTEGVLCRWLRDASGSHEVYRGGFTVSNSDAVRLLLNYDGPRNRSAADLEEMTRQMASRCRESLQTTYALATGPPSVATTGAPPEIHIAVALPENVHVVSHAFVGHPDILVERAAKQALDALRYHVFLG